MQFIKKYIQEKNLKSTYNNNKRRIEIKNFDFVNSVGIISNPENEEDLNQITKIISHFRMREKNIFSLIYNNKPFDNDFTRQNFEAYFINRKNCDWFEIPKKDTNLSQFINKEFDLLIDLSFSPIFCLKSIFIQSQARLKVMPGNEFSKQFADLMLETADTKNKFSFITELIHYLEIINKNQK